MFDPAYLLHLLFCYKIQWFQAFLNCCRLLNHDGVMKGRQLIFSSLGHMTQVLGKSKNWWFFITLPGRLKLLWNFSFVLLHCPNKCQFFVFQLICKVNRRKEIICCCISPASLLTRNRLNQCADDITRQSMSYFNIFSVRITFHIHHVFHGTITHHSNFDSILAWFFRHILQHPHLPPNGSNCSSMQTAEPIKYNDLRKSITMSQISWNAAILSSKWRSVLVALSSNLITDKRNQKQYLPWLQGILIFLSHPFYTVTLCSSEVSNTPP